MAKNIKFNGEKSSMGKILMDNSELDTIFGKSNYERKKNKIFVYKSTDIYSKGYHKWLREDDTILKTGNKLCKSGRPSFINEISVLRSKIEKLIF